jgi:hypothetical protein
VWERSKQLKILYNHEKKDEIFYAVALLLEHSKYERASTDRRRRYARPVGFIGIEEQQFRIIAASGKFGQSKQLVLIDKSGRRDVGL